MAKKISAYLLIVFITILTLFGYYLLVLDNAKATVPIPQPHVPCDATEDPEFNSLRPYQASPCDPDVYETRLYCGMDVIPVKDITVNRLNGSCDATGCDFVVPESVFIQLDWDSAELPIAGQTQLVPNSNNHKDYLDSGLRMSEYVSWYLNGVNYRAEDPYLDMDDPIDINKVVSFSGPINKLLPLFIQTWRRYDETEKASQGVAQENKRHDQIVGCNLNIFGFNLAPFPCYGFETESGLIIPNALVFPIRDEHRILEYKDGPEQPVVLQEFPGGTFDNFQDYWLAYLEWRGKNCYSTDLLPFFDNKNLIFCINGFAPDWVAELWPYVPYSSTEDRKGEIGVGFPEGLELAIQPTYDEGNEVEIIEIELDTEGQLQGMETLYFPHMKEDTELADILQETYVYKGGEFGGGANDKNLPFKDWPPYNTYRCDLKDVRWNPGDDLFGEWTAGAGGAPKRSNGQPDAPGPVTGTIDYTAKFRCSAEEFDNEGNCTKRSLTAVSVYLRMPLVDELWERTVTDQKSIFKRIYPKLGTHGMFEELKDFPAVTSANYTAPTADDVWAGEPLAERPGSQAELYLPHMGGILEYFLYGIQDALRPQFAKTSFPPGQLPPGTGGTPGPSPQCTLGTGDCSPSELQNYFSDGQYCGINEANIASQLCQRESNSYFNAANTGCLTGRSYDFSLGYFQINMVPIPYYDDAGNLIELREGRCPGAFVTDVNLVDPPQCRIKNAGSDNCSDLIPGLTQCNSALRACIERFLDPVQNVQWAANRAGCQSVPNGTCQCDWSPWNAPGASCNPIP